MHCSLQHSKTRLALDFRRWRFWSVAIGNHALCFDDGKEGGLLLKNKLQMSSRAVTQGSQSTTLMSDGQKPWCSTQVFGFDIDSRDGSGRSQQPMCNGGSSRRRGCTEKSAANN